MHYSTRKGIEKKNKHTNISKYKKSTALVSCADE